MHGTEPDSHATIAGGPAMEAIATWLDGRYQAGDEPALLRVIRRETGTALSDGEIKVIVYEAHDQGCDAPAALSRLLEADRRQASPRPPR